MRITYPSTWSQNDRDALDALFIKARKTRKWFYTRYQEMWFSPDALEAEQKEGNFLWGAVNWQLRDPQEYLTEAQERAASAKAEADRIAEEIAAH